MPRGANAELAVRLFDSLVDTRGWGPEEAWKGIAVLLLTCKIQRNGWRRFHDVVVYRESNDFKFGPKGANATIKNAQSLSEFLAQELGIARSDLCGFIGQYWSHRSVARLQQNNLVGHAFRSIVTRILQRFGAPGIRYEEEVSARALFTGYPLSTRSESPAIDIVAFRGDRPVAMVSARWRFRHDRVDVVDEATAYVPPAARIYGNVPFYAVLGEFSVQRLAKILAHAPPVEPHGPIAAAVHFEPRLITEGLNEPGSVSALKSLDWLRRATHTWA